MGMSMASCTSASSEHHDLFDPGEAEEMLAEFRKGSFFSSEARSFREESARGSAASVGKATEKNGSSASSAQKTSRTSQPSSQLQRKSTQSSGNKSSYAARDN